MAESIEAELAKCSSISNAYGMITDRLRRVLESIGPDRRPRPVSDGSSALADYFARPPQQREAAE
jgi:hypothetical protein